jgi:hypothetical protein
VGTWVTYEPSPSGSLNGSCGGVELLLEGFHGPKVLFNGLLERAFSQLATVPARGCEVLPEQRVVDMTYSFWFRSATVAKGCSGQVIAAGGGRVEKDTE